MHKHGSSEVVRNKIAADVGGDPRAITRGVICGPGEGRRGKGGATPEKASTRAKLSGRSDRIIFPPGRGEKKEGRMYTRIYTIYDKVAEQSGPVFQAPNDATAQRQMRHLCAQPGIVADDFQLWCIGEFEDTPRDGEVCRLTPYATSRLISAVLEPVVPLPIK